jgi:hypothetical protein
MVWKRIFGLKSNEVVGGWRKFYNKLNSLYTSQGIIKMIKSRKMMWAWHVSFMGEKRNVCRVLVERNKTTAKTKM